MNISKLEKMKLRLLSLPKDYKYSELIALLSQLGFIDSNKGHTSGSRVKFYRPDDKRVILLHKPHASDVMPVAAVKDIANFLSKIGEFDEK